MQYLKRGFTIVELLIVIVVIGILAAITIVAYNGIQNRANDSAIQTDLNNVAKKIREFAILKGQYPKGATDLATLNIKLSKKAYGNHYYNGVADFNFVYCWPGAANPDNFAVVVAGLSGKIFAYTNGSVKELSTGWSGGSVGICNNVGNPIDTGSSRDWFYDGSYWQSFVAG
jgi:prepilin-type N-terminal cleavage/methylation domain-containing protein